MNVRLNEHDVANAAAMNYWNFTKLIWWTTVKKIYFFFPWKGGNYLKWWDRSQFDVHSKKATTFIYLGKLAVFLQTSINYFLNPTTTFLKDDLGMRQGKKEEVWKA